MPEQLAIVNSTATFAVWPLNGNNRSPPQPQQQRFSLAQFLALARNGVCTEYAPHRFHAIVMRMRSGHRQQSSAATATATTTTTTTTALIFRSGRVVLTGIGGVPPNQIHAQCAKQAKRVCRRVGAALKWGGFPALALSLSVNAVELRNLVTTLHLPYRLNIEQMAQHLSSLGQNGEKRVGGGEDETRLWLFRCETGVPRLVHFLRPSLYTGDTQAFKWWGGGGRKTSKRTNKKIGGNTLATCLFFITGTVIVTGVRQPEELEQAVAAVRALCQDHQRK
ncbi:hypothetical protein niasHT_026505 [Heterodera trifolii]|uniref:Uncharacterized protein n=1 Tax=Heterodera trifolii TaxID=157864 RepID=A0ABD2JKW3_9BILA